MILMPETGSPEALTVATGLHQQLIHTRFHMKSGLELSASASVGLATCPPETAAVHAIIGAADARMYAVKNDGRGKVKGA